MARNAKTAQRCLLGRFAVSGLVFGREQLNIVLNKGQQIVLGI